MKQAIIVSGGETNVTFGKQYIETIKKETAETPYFIAVDSGMRFFYEAGITPDCIVGDFDSADSEVKAYFETLPEIEWVRLVPEKDDTDTECAIRLAIKKEYQKIHLLGATGNRLDHMLGNIGLLGIGLNQNAEIILADKNNRVRMITSDISIEKEKQYGKYVSILPVTKEVTGVTLLGMKYPLENYTITCFNSIGVSNEIIADTAEIKLKDGILLVFETKD